ncbi:MAG: hypothetical protein V4724_06035 [Pseudomonadota bacterium]
MIDQFCDWLAEGALSHALQATSWAVPLIQTIHILGIAVVLSSMAMLGLRMTGLAYRSQAIAEVGARLLPWMWRALPVMVVTGALLIIAEPKRSLPNAAFQFKMLMLLAMVAVSLIIGRAIAIATAAAGRQGDAVLRDTAQAKLIGLTVLIAWTGIVVAGRWIAYI